MFISLNACFSNPQQSALVFRICMYCCREPSFSCTVFASPKHAKHAMRRRESHVDGVAGSFPLGTYKRLCLQTAMDKLLPKLSRPVSEILNKNLGSIASVDCQILNYPL